MLKLRMLTFGVAAVAAVSNGAYAQTYPSQTVRIVVPFSAGSITDTLARIISGKLRDLWKQEVIVENRPGPPGTIGVSRSAPDGYTLMLTSNGHTVASVVNKNNQFDPVNDFSGVTQIASVPLVMIIPPNFPAKTVQDLIAQAKQKPGQLNFASAGIASTSFLAGEIFRQAAKISLVHIPYKGSPEAMTAVIRGDSQMSFATIPFAKEFREAAKARSIAVTAPKRVEQLPDVPTIAEAGVPDYKYDTWFGLMAPANTPRVILSKVSADVARVLQMPDVRASLLVLGALPIANKPEEFDATIREDTEKNVRILRNANVGVN